MSKFMDAFKDLCTKSITEDPETEIKRRFTREEKMLRITEYLAADRYPLSVFSRDEHVISLKLGNKIFYPITFRVDASWRKWLDRRPVKHRLHDPKTDLSYVLYE